MVTDEQKEREGSGYYKAVFGCRPRGLVTGAEAYALAAAEMKRRMETVAGRNALRDEGWMLEGDPNWDYRE